MGTVSMLIGSEARADSSTFRSVDPFRLEPWIEAPNATFEDVDDAVIAARAALEGPWGAASSEQP